jgi:hypothetical protein
MLLVFRWVYYGFLKLEINSLSQIFKSFTTTPYLAFSNFFNPLSFFTRPQNIARFINNHFFGLD